jgi:hypothetical protein
MTAPSVKNLTAEKAEFIEKSVNAYLQYTIDCLDNLRRDGNNVLQWLFGVITGGMALIGTLISMNLYHIAIGTSVAVVMASLTASKLVTDLGSKDTHPPGNLSASLNTMLDDTIDSMRWREASGLDERITANNAVVTEVAEAVDKARARFAQIPRWFLGGTAIAYLGDVLGRFIIVWASGPVD